MRGDFERVDIGGDPELEAAYRTSIPVVEIDGERAFTFFVQPEALRRAVEGRLTVPAPCRGVVGTMCAAVTNRRKVGRWLIG